MSVNAAYLPHYDTMREYEAPIHEYRVAMGLTLRELSEQAGVPATSIGALANGSMSPLLENNSGVLKKTAQKLCDFFDVSPGELFPRYICEIDRRTKYQFETWPYEMASERMARDPYDEYADTELLDMVLQILTRRQAKSVCAHFYLGWTYNDIGEKLGVVAQRAREIVEKSLSRLRHPKYNIREYA